jgi:hypothetical protein
MAQTLKTLSAEIDRLKVELEAEMREHQATLEAHALKNTPPYAYLNFMESINFSAEVQRGGDYRVTNQTEFDRRIIGETMIDKCFYIINGKGPNQTQQGLTGRIANLTAQANRYKVEEGYDSPLFISTIAELEAATTKLDLITDLNDAARMYHEEKTPSRNGLPYCAYLEQRQGNAPTNPTANRTLTAEEIAKYQALGISVDLDAPANATAQAERIELEDDIADALAAAANS